MPKSNEEIAVKMVFIGRPNIWPIKFEVYGHTIQGLHYLLFIEFENKS